MFDEQTYSGKDKEERLKYINTPYMKDLGIFTSSTDASFKSDQSIKRDLALDGQLPPVYSKPLVQPPTVSELMQVAEERKKTMREMLGLSENQIGITLHDTSVIHVMGDLHFGNPNTDNIRIAQELEAVKQTPNHYIMLIGDLVDGIWWGGASGSEQALTLSEQYAFLHGLFKEMQGKILVGMSGEHDSKWASKTGQDPYFMMADEAKAPYIRGMAEISVDIGDAQYNIVANHRHRGHSVYNKNHPTFRTARFHLQGGDIYISAHTHQKQISQEAIREFGGARPVTHISIGPYKTHDEYGDREGFVHQTPEEMYGASFRLHKDIKQVEVCNDILQAIKQWS